MCPSSPPPLSEASVADLRRRVVECVSRVCPRWLADQAEDIAQNAVLRLVERLRASGGNREFSTIYLRKAAHGATVDEIRRRVRIREQPLPDGLDRNPAPRGNPERESRGREIGRAIGDCLRRLTDPRRLAVTLFLRGCSVPETAGRLGWTPKRTEHLVYRGLAQLRQCLSAKGMKP